MKIKIQILGFLLCLLLPALKAQNQTKKWYFGFFAGLDFSTPSPSILTNGGMQAFEGCVTESDAAGNLLFYSQGTIVYNANHVFMANGVSLIGNNNAIQSSVVVKKPGTANIYYIFTMAPGSGALGAHYSAIDMSLAAGMGSVTVKNSFLFSPAADKITAVKHCNGTDTWVLLHKWGSAQFNAYLVTAAGVSTTAVLSTLGSTVAGPGSMKFSPNGKKLCVATYDKGYELFDFDRSTGVLSNSLVLSTDSNAYYSEFSADGRRLYGTFPNCITQWDLCAGSPSAIAASMTTITPSVSSWPGTIQNAPDGKIYVAYNFKNYLAAITSPTSLGMACNFVDSAQSVSPKQSYWGLPNYLSNYFDREPAPVHPAFTKTLSCNTLSLTAPTLSNPTLCDGSGFTFQYLKWDFGEPAAGPANTSLLQNPVHTYFTPGTYTVKLIFQYECTADTQYQVVNTGSPVIISTSSGSSGLCMGQSTSLTVTGATNYTWSTGAASPVIFVTPTITSSYSVTGTSSITSCMASASLAITVYTLPIINISGNSTICKGESTFLFANGSNTYTWSTLQTTGLILVTPSVNTNYTVAGTNTLGSCSASQTIAVTVNECTGVDKTFQEKEGVKLYPNPGEGIVHIELPAAGTLFVYDQLGIQKRSLKLSGGKNILDLKTLNEGLYNFQIRGLGWEVHLRYLKLNGPH